METNFDIYDTELLDVLISRTKKLRDNKWIHPMDTEAWVKDVDETWQEYKARFEAYKKKYEEKENKK